MTIIVFCIWLACAVFFALPVMDDMAKQNESLIIRNDSLRMLQIKTKIQLSQLESHLDSIASNGPKKRVTSK
jgi:hypothetical protein